MFIPHSPTECRYASGGWGVGVGDAGTLAPSNGVPGVHGHNFSLLKKNDIYKDDKEPARDDREAMD